VLEIARFEARRRLRGTLLLSGALLAFAGLVIGLFPSIRESGVDFETYVESFPPEVQRAFLGEVTNFTRIEGFLAVELYQWLWLLVLGVYFAYAAASLVAGEIESGTIDLLNVNPISRTRVVVGKFLSLVPAVVLVNAVTLLGTYVGVGLIGEDIEIWNLLLLHGLSVVYLLACAGLGLVASVVFDVVRRAQAAAGGGVFAMFLVDTLTLETDYEWIGDPAFSRYFEPTAILVEGDVDWGGIATLLVVIVALVVVSAEYFERKDIS
jgi:ABC-2 type transport system permease protein